MNKIKTDQNKLNLFKLILLRSVKKEQRGKESNCQKVATTHQQLHSFTHYAHANHVSCEENRENEQEQSATGETYKQLILYII